MSWRDITLPGEAMRRRVAFDEVEGKLVLESRQENINDCIEENRAHRNADRSSSSLWNGRTWVKVASIPNWLIEKWKVEEGIDFLRWNEEDKAKVMRKLNDNEYLELRTAPGRI